MDENSDMAVGSPVEKSRGPASHREVGTNFAVLVRAHRRIRTDKSMTSETRRYRTARVLFTASGMWDALLDDFPVDRYQSTEPEDTQPVGVSMYDDDMLTHDLFDSIWDWNDLGGWPEQPRATDELDTEIARTLVRHLGMVVAVEYWSDLRKRNEEAIANMLLVHPTLLNSMKSAARREPLALEVTEMISAATKLADMHRSPD